MAFVEDHSAFFRTAEFAVDATWNGGTVQVIVDNPARDVLGVNTRTPGAVGYEAQLAGIAQGDAIVIGGVNYKVINPEPDGTGMIEFGLEAQ